MRPIGTSDFIPRWPGITVRSRFRGAVAVRRRLPSTRCFLGFLGLFSSFRLLLPFFHGHFALLPFRILRCSLPRHLKKRKLKISPFHTDQTLNESKKVP
jgi:hypothetical protein